MSSAHGEVITYYLSDSELEYYRNLPSKYDPEDRPKINWKWERGNSRKREEQNTK